MSDDPRNRRKAVRVEKPLDLEYWVGDLKPIPARVEEISEGGMFLDSTHLLTVGSVFEFRLDLQDGDAEPFVGRARVVRVQPLTGVGVEIIELSAARRERLRMFVASVFFGYKE